MEKFLFDTLWLFADEEDNIFFKSNCFKASCFDELEKLKLKKLFM